MTEFNTLFSKTGKVFRDEGNALDKKKLFWRLRAVCIRLDITLGKDDYFSLAKQGSLRLIVKFGEALDDPVTVVAYAEFQNVIEIDKNRNVIYDFAV